MVAILGEKLGQSSVPVSAFSPSVLLSEPCLVASRRSIGLLRVSSRWLDAANRAVLLGVCRAENCLQTWDEKAQSLVEYGIVGSVLWMVILITLKNVGTHLTNVFNKVAGKLHS